MRLQLNDRKERKLSQGMFIEHYVELGSDMQLYIGSQRHQGSFLAQRCG